MSKYGKIDKNKYTNTNTSISNTFQKMVEPLSTSLCENVVIKTYPTTNNASLHKTSNKYTTQFENKYVPQQSNMIAKSMSTQITKSNKGLPIPEGDSSGITRMVEQFANFVSDLISKQTVKNPFDKNVIRTAMKQIADETGYSVKEIKKFLNRKDVIDKVKNRLLRLQPIDLTSEPKLVPLHSSGSPLTTSPSIKGSRNISGEKRRVKGTRSMRDPNEDFVERLQNETLARENPRTATLPVARAESYTPDDENNMFYSPIFFDLKDYLSELVKKPLGLPDAQMLHDVLPQKLLEHVGFESLFNDIYNTIGEARNATFGRGQNPNDSVKFKTFHNITIPLYNLIDYANRQPPKPVASASSFYPAAARTTVRRDLGLTRPPSRYLTNDTLSEHLEQTLVPSLGKYDKELAYLIDNFDSPAQFFRDFAAHTHDVLPELYRSTEQMMAANSRTNPTRIARTITDNPYILGDYDTRIFRDKGNDAAAIALAHPFYTTYGLFPDPSKVTPLQLSRTWAGAMNEFSRWMKEGGLQRYATVFPTTARPSVAVQEARSNIPVTPPSMKDKTKAKYKDAQQYVETQTGSYLNPDDAEDRLFMAVLGFSPEEVNVARQEQTLNNQYRQANQAKDQATLDLLTSEYQKQQQNIQEGKPVDPYYAHLLDKDEKPVIPLPKKGIRQRISEGIGDILGTREPIAPVDTATIASDDELKVLLQKYPSLSQATESDLKNPVTRRRLLEDIRTKRESLNPFDYGFD